MLEVTVEVIPHGIESERRVIGKMQIVNTLDNPRRPEYGNYRVSVGSETYHVVEHKRDLGFWKLMHSALSNVFSGPVGG